MKITNTTTNTSQRPARRPPAIANKLVALLLRSPFHGRISKDILLLKFTGRKTGKTYTIPVGYARSGNTVTMFTDHTWWKNLEAQPQVEVCLQGKWHTARAEVLHEDKTQTERDMLDFVRHRPRVAQAYGVRFAENGEVNQESLRGAAQRFTLIPVLLNGS